MLGCGLMATKAEINAAANAIAATHQEHTSTLPWPLIERQATVALAAAEKAHDKQTEQ